LDQVVDLGFLKYLIVDRANYYIYSSTFRKIIHLKVLG